MQNGILDINLILDNLHFPCVGENSRDIADTTRFLGRYAKQSLRETLITFNER